MYISIDAHGYRGQLHVSEEVLLCVGLSFFSLSSPRRQEPLLPLREEED